MLIAVYTVNYAPVVNNVGLLEGIVVKNKRTATYILFVCFSYFSQTKNV